LYVVVVDQLEIGRSGPGLLLTDPGISRRHLAVEPVGGQIVVSDIGSMNGTTIDGVLLRLPRLLRVGETVRLGQCTIELVMVGRPFTVLTASG
jgi:pSer/pThr/pTyr-binding forkhead associated (FHA) protein